MGGGQRSSDKIANKLASELLFTKKVLTEASWTGISRTKLVDEKLPFRTLRGVLSAVDEIMRNADNRWCSEDTEKLFRDKLLKHAKKRNEALEKKLTNVIENQQNDESDKENDSELQINAPV